LRLRAQTLRGFFDRLIIISQNHLKRFQQKRFLKFNKMTK